MNETIIDILSEENILTNPRVSKICDTIVKRHLGRVKAVIYYGSSLRDLDKPGKMLDFYVLVDSYRKTHKNLVRATLNYLLPPAVYYYEKLDKNNILNTCKYSIISLSEFEKLSGEKSLLSMIWGRFCQPCSILYSESSAVTERILIARENSVRHMASQITPLLSGPIKSSQFWAKGFYESYKTELRPESSEKRAIEIVERYENRYSRITAVLFGKPNEDGYYVIPQETKIYAKTKWFIRRLIGKPMTAIRVINSAATFDGGLDYILMKLRNHSGVTILPTSFEKRHPVICSPIMGWKLWRKGAFK
ncbi:MAG: hypothetical protein P8H55_00300 [Hellea sp.]|nr:hypothetical protein [Hellea sp.]